MQVIEKSDGLDSFSKTHLICEYAISILVPVGYHPVEALELKIFEFAIIFIDGNIAIAILFPLLLSTKSIKLIL